MSRYYTAEEDALLKAAKLEDLTELAERLGRKRHNIVNRRTRLLRGDDMTAHFRRPPPKPEVKPAIRDPLAGRPDWFDDTATITRLRSGR